jgi:hypothetical protein
MTQALRAESNQASMVGMAMQHKVSFYATALIALVCASCQVDQSEFDESQFRDIGHRWAIIDGDNEFVGWLSTPGPDDIADHDDIFSEAAPPAVFVTEKLGGEHGFSLIQTGIVTGALNGPVHFTGPMCTGIAHGWIATYSGGGPIPAPHCTDGQIDFLSDKGMVAMKYKTESEFETMLDEQWPGAAGQVMRSAAGAYYLLPIDQQWPEMLTTQSIAGPDDTCVELINPTPGCSVRLLETDWSPTSAAPPFSLVELEVVL